MTILLAWLPHLADIDRWIASRFACYASSAVECLKHPVVLFEGSVFFESLSSRRLVAESNCCVVKTSSTIAIAMPLVLCVIKPGSAHVISESVDFMDYECPMLQKSVFMCLSKMCSAEEDHHNRIRSDLFLFLHDFCGRRRLQLISEFRSLAQSFRSHQRFCNLQSIEAEVVSLIHLVLKSNSNEDSLLQWLLLCRCLISGTGKSGHQDESDTVTSPIERVVTKCRATAQSEAYLSLRCSNPPRWQLKCVAANVGSVALNMLIRLDQTNSIDYSIFNISSAKFKHGELEEETKVGELFASPAFYLEELILAACSASASTSNHSELLSVQTSGIRLLTSLFGAFGGTLDPTNDGSMALEQYSSQILSAVKHSLKPELSEESVVSGCHLLFSAGCDALLVLIENNFVSDSLALKRLMKPIMLTNEDSVSVKFPSEENADTNVLVASPHCITDDLRSYPSFRLSKLCFIARASMLVFYDEINQSSATVIVEEAEHNQQGKAIHSAAAAIDGFMLMTGAKNISGLSFKNRADLDVTVIEDLCENWPTLCASAISSLTKLIKEPEGQIDNMKTFEGWLEKTSFVALSGLKVSLSDSTPVKNRAGCAQACIFAIRLLITESSNILQPSDISDVINTVMHTVIYPTLGLLENRLFTESNSSQLLKQSCGLLQDACQVSSDCGSLSQLLQQSILHPLSAFQNGKFTLERENDFIISSFIRSSALLLMLKSENERDQLEKALLQFSLSILNKLKPSEHTTGAESECILLLKTCVEKSVLSADEWRQVTAFAAKNELWDAWSIFVPVLPSGVGIECSMIYFKKSLGNLNTPARQNTNALIAFRTGLQSSLSEHPNLIGTVLHFLGFEIFQLLRIHSLNMGSESNADDRLLLCAECIKIIMMAYQYLTSALVEEGKFVGFLVPLFSLLVDCISFNGLPNTPSGNVGADDKIGRICAQVFVHIARTTPPMFKSTMTAVLPECRSAIESAVRADMSGYASTSQGPAKKKLNLKGFVR